MVVVFNSLNLNTSTSDTCGLHLYSALQIHEIRHNVVNGLKYLIRVWAMIGVMVWAMMLGKPEERTGENWVWLNDGKPGV